MVNNVDLSFHVSGVRMMPCIPRCQTTFNVSSYCILVSCGGLPVSLTQSFVQGFSEISYKT